MNELIKAINSRRFLRYRISEVYKMSGYETQIILLDDNYEDTKIIIKDYSKLQEIKIMLENSSLLWY